MSFTDLTFLFVFLPVALLLYYMAKDEFKEILLLLLSLLFYSCGSAEYVSLLIVSLTINVFLGRLITNLKYKKTTAFALFVTGIIWNLIILGYYKYFSFVAGTVNRIFYTSFETKNLLLPLGLSFYVFKAISYLADVYSGKIEKNSMLTAALYMFFFGQVQSGPVARYKSFEIFGGGQNRRVFRPESVVRFSIGFGKKVLLANVLSHVTTEVFDSTGQLSTLLAWTGAVCYSLQLYYDFSGYSDMADGICGMFGYDCPKNFDYPYTARSVTEFWRKWHITLGAWFRDYVYIPLGGSKVRPLRLYFDLFVVWLLTGLWHGAGWNFVAWGMGYFVIIVFEKTMGLPEKLSGRVLKCGYRIAMLFFINFQWVMFRSTGFNEAVSFIHAMVIPIKDRIADARAVFLIKNYLVFIIAAIVFALPLVPVLKKFCSKKTGTRILFQIVFYIGVVLLFTGALSMVVSGQNNPFLYADF